MKNCFPCTLQRCIQTISNVTGPFSCHGHAINSFRIANAGCVIHCSVIRIQIGKKHNALLLLCCCLILFNPKQTYVYARTYPCVATLMYRLEPIPVLQHLCIYQNLSLCYNTCVYARTYPCVTTLMYTLEPIPVLQHLYIRQNLSLCYNTYVYARTYPCVATLVYTLKPIH